MASKLKIEFDGFEEVVARLSKLEGDVKGTTEKALKESRDYVTPKLHSAMAKHRKTGQTESAIRNSEPVSWSGTVASIPVGFDIYNGGLPSIFLMYGAKPHRIGRGTPRMHPGTKQDKNLYNAIYGSATRNAIKQIQEDIFYDAIRKADG